MKYEYIESNIDWIGKYPKHWKLTTVKKEFNVIPSNVDKKSEENEDEVILCNYVDVYYNDFIDSNIDFMIATANENERKKFKLKIDDVLITKDSEDPYDIAVPALVLEDIENLICGYHLSIIRSTNNKILGSFLFWALKDEVIATQLWREACGITRWAIASRHIKNSIIPFPPKDEQIAIVNFLNNACSNVDKVIDLIAGTIKIDDKESNSQVNILRQYKKALTHEVVTGKKQVFGIEQSKEKLQTA